MQEFELKYPEVKRGNQCHDFNMDQSVSDGNVYAEYLKDQVINYKALRSNAAVLK